MMEIILKSVLCSGIFIGLYLLVLSREKMFHFNRIYLLGSLVLSFVIPFIVIELPVLNTIKDISPVLPETTFIERPIDRMEPAIYASQHIATAETTENPNWLPFAMISGYFLVSLAFLIRFLWHFLQMVFLILKNEKQLDGRFTTVIIPSGRQVFSFLRYVFVPRNLLKSESVCKEIMQHEHAHIKQFHSMDIILIELLLIVFWFNPFLYMYRHAIKLNHEYLADQAVLKKMGLVGEYQKLLFEHIPGVGNPIVSTFHYHDIKKRFIMMTKKTTQIKKISLQVCSIILCAVLFATFSQKMYAQEGKGVSKSEFRAYKKAIKNATITERNESGKKVKRVDPKKLDQKEASDLYARMTPKQQQKVYTPPAPKNHTFGFKGLTEEISKAASEFSGLGAEIANEFIAGELPNLINDIQKTFTSEEWIASISEIQQNGEEIQKYFESPEWKQRISEIEENAKKIEEKFKSPEWKEKIRKIEEKAKQTEEKFNSPEWKDKIKKIEENAKRIEEKFNSPEWKEKIKAIEEKANDAVRQAEKEGQKSI